MIKNIRYLQYPSPRWIGDSFPVHSLLSYNNHGKQLTPFLMPDYADPGDVQCMTAGSGILHEEFHLPFFSQSGSTLEMVQLWINLPAKDKMIPPGYPLIAK